MKGLLQAKIEIKQIHFFVPQNVQIFIEEMKTKINKGKITSLETN